MKRVFSIVLALALALTMVIGSALPAAAATGIQVVVDEPVAGEVTFWTISFQVEALLQSGVDYIDVYFPVGTGLGGTLVQFGTGATRGAACIAAGLAAGVAVNELFPLQVRVALPVDVAAGAYVCLIFDPITNPTSCFHTVTIVQSNCCTTVSPEFPIFSLKMELLDGKNLISLPAYPEDEAIEVVFADLFAYAALTAGTATPFEFEVWYWDAEAQGWLKFVSDTSFDEISTIEPGKAYWVKVSADKSFYFKGEPYPECQGPPQKFCWYVPSWNMVGFVSLLDMWASEYLQNAMLPWPHQTSYAVSAIFSFDAVNQIYVDEGWWPATIVAPGDPGDVTLVSGEGYFMSFLADACIIPPIQ